MSTVKVDNIQTSGVGVMPIIKDSAGTEVMQGCTAWVRVVGTTGVIVSSFNVSSVTRLGVGSLLIMFSVPMSTTSYVVTGTATANVWGNADTGIVAPARSLVSAAFKTVSIQVDTAINSDTSGLGYDMSNVSIAVFGGK